jgi:hypothetical protein
MWDDELTKANKAFLDQLPPEMVELASEAVELQEKLKKQKMNMNDLKLSTSWK